MANFKKSHASDLLRKTIPAVAGAGIFAPIDMSVVQQMNRAKRQKAAEKFRHDQVRKRVHMQSGGWAYWRVNPKAIVAVDPKSGVKVYFDPPEKKSFLDDVEPAPVVAKAPEVEVQVEEVEPEVDEAPVPYKAKGRGRPSLKLNKSESE